MTTAIQSIAAPPIEYPDSDGLPMSENTLQFTWIVTIKESLEALFADDPDVFIAGDLLWYPVEGRPDIRIAPDTLVAFGRPKGHRGSYKQWAENGIPPQVVFEVLSPGNRSDEMERKRLSYEKFGVEEYYVYDPDNGSLEGWLLRDGRLSAVADMDGFVSPRLNIRFEPGPGPNNLTIRDPFGHPFLSPLEQRRADQRLIMEANQHALEQEHHAEQERLRAEEERLRAEQERLRAEEERLRAEQARLRAERYAAKLRELGIEPD